MAVSFGTHKSGASYQKSSQLSKMCQVLAASISEPLQDPYRVLIGQPRIFRGWLFSFLCGGVSSPLSLPALISLQLCSFTVAASRMPMKGCGRW